MSCEKELVSPMFYKDTG